MLTVADHESGPPNPFHTAWRTARGWLIGAVFTLAAAAILTFPIFPVGQVALEVGEVAPRDTRSPRHTAFKSEILTEDARKKAEAGVAPMFTPPDARVARQQVARARAVADFIRAVRADSYALPSQKRAAMASIEGMSLSSSQYEYILAFREEAWNRIEAETISALDLAMRGEIRQSNVPEIRARIPAMVGLDLTEDQGMIAAALAQQFVEPNSFYDIEATTAARTKARQSVEPVSRSFEAGEIIVREGQSVTPLDIEALDHLGLRQTKLEWIGLASMTLLMSIITVVLGLFIWRMERPLWQRPRNMALLAILVLLFILTGKVLIPGRVVLPYMFPAAALAIVLTAIAGPGLAMLVTGALGIVAGVIGNGSLELAVYAIAGSVVAVLTVGRMERLSAFFRAGLYVAVVNIAVLLAFRLSSGFTDVIGLLTLTAAGIANGGLAASLAVGGLFLIGNLFDVTTTLQLLELARPNHPLMQLLLMKAPGTYHHTIMVVNLAEQAAERIRADTLLVRVGAFYHDVGKTVRPYMFVENQVEGGNVHEKLDPLTSAEIIIRHVTDGLDLARRYRLPSRIRAFIPEHHGTMRASFLYQKAIQQAGGDAAQVDERLFRYPGPKPSSKESALVMLADGCEAAVRASHPSSADEISEIVRKVISERIACGQLNECMLTVRDLDLIRESFTRTFQGMFHPRIQYPEMQTPQRPELASRNA